MTRTKLQGLQRIADIMLDQQLSGLRQANAAQDETRGKLLALDPVVDWDGCNLQASAQAATLYQAWADIRRRELNLQLARQTAAVLQAQDAARLAFGRSTALTALKSRDR
jgi:hypothetical protein